MKTLALVSFKDESTGELGLGLADMPRDESTNAASSGDLIAHDIVEHVNGPERIGTISDEFEALGALWYVRGQHNDIRRDSRGSFYSPEQNLAFDVVRMFRDHVCGAHVDPAKRTRPCEADDAFDGVLEFATEKRMSEFEGSDVQAAREMWPAYKRACLSGLRTGYRKAAARWETKGRFAANSQFWAIAKAVDPFTRGLEFEGQTFRLTYGDGEARCIDTTYDEEQYA